MGKFKKFAFPFLTAIFSVWFSIVFALGIFVGYISTYFGHKKITNNGVKNSVVISLGKWKIHFHHWLMGSVALLSVYISGLIEVIPKIFVGIVGGVVFHGLYLYDNWHKIIIKKSKAKF